MTDLLVASDVRKEFGGLVAVNDVDFTIPQGSIVSLIGPNGAGKTTFFNMLTGVYKPTAGKIVFDGADLAGKPPHAITQLGIGRTFQNIRLFQQMTALENVLVGMHSRLKGGIVRTVLRTPGLKRRGASGGRPRARAASLLQPHRRRRRVGTQPLLRRPAAPGGRARARDRAQAAPARRADGRHEPTGDCGVHGLRREASQRAGLDRPDDRARHEGRDGDLRPRDGARLRREDRRGCAEGRAEGRARDRGVPRQGGRRHERPPGELILELEDVHTYYGSIEALKGITIDVRQGEIVTLIGANGAGKSTTLRSINGLNRPRRGTIRFQGQDITNAARARDREARDRAVTRRGGGSSRG